MELCARKICRGGAMTIDEFIELLNKVRNKHDRGDLPILVDMQTIEAIELKLIYKPKVEITAFNIMTKDYYHDTKQ